MRGRSDGRVVFSLRGAILLAILMLRPLTAGAAPILLGDSVEGTLYSAGTVLTQFTSPAIVGGGVEFTGLVRDPGRAGTLWDVWVDIGATGFTIGWHSPTPDAFIASSVPLLTLSLSGLNFTPTAAITGFTRTGYSCMPAESVACNMGGAADVNLGFADDAIMVGFRALRAGETYTFDFTTAETTPSPVPEPSSLALLGTGFATVIVGRFRRRAPRL